MRENHKTQNSVIGSSLTMTFLFAGMLAFSIDENAQASAVEEHVKQNTEKIGEVEQQVDVQENKIEENEEKIKTVEEKIQGAFNYFGAGPAITVNAWHKDRLNGPPELDENRIVRLEKQSDSSVGVFLEAHYLWQTEHIIPPVLGIESLSIGCPNLHGENSDTICGFGPFVGVQPGGSDDIIEAIGAGVMWGFKGTGKNLFNSTQFNIGFGVFVDPTVETLGDGVFENQPLPVGETVIRTKEDYQTNFMVMFTVSPF